MKLTKSLLNELHEGLRQSPVPWVGERLLVALSGGPDSVALTRLLVLLSRRHRFKITAAYVHHGLRKAADRELSFCRQFAQAQGIDFLHTRVATSAYARRHHLGVEESARILRYQALERMALTAGARLIVTAHTRNDQAETLLMRLVRGSGLRGAAGIRAGRRLGKAWLIRPLLRVDKLNILAWLKAVRIPYCLDRSNEKLIFTRNYLRKRVIPLLRRVNPRADAALAEFSRQAGQTQDWLTAQAQKSWLKQARYTSKRVVFSLKAFKRAHPALRYELGCMSLKHLSGQGSGYASEPWGRIEHAVCEETPRIIKLPFSIAFEIKRDRVIFNKI